MERLEKRMSHKLSEYAKGVWKKRKVRLIFGFALFFTMIILNCVLYQCESYGKRYVVVVDAGHGGNDPGKVSADGKKEKDLNLSIANLLKEQLEKEGVTVIMTRQQDASLSVQGARNQKVSDMQQRRQIIESASPDYMISIHQNSYPDSNVSGPQVFYRSNSEESEKLAKSLQANLIADLNPEKKREAKTGDSYYILKHCPCPGVIVECGFLSSPRECELLCSQSYQEALAQSIVRTILSQ